MAFRGRNRLLRRLIAVLLIAAVINVWCFPERPAEAFLAAAAALIAIGIMEIALHPLMQGLKNAASGSLTSAGQTLLHEVALMVEMSARYSLEKKLYSFDHNRLVSDDVDLGSEPMQASLRDYYGMAGLTDDNFDNANPGYRDVSPGQPFINFPEKYRERMERLSEHGMVKLLANRAAALAVTNADNPAADTAQAVHNTLMAAGEHMKGGYTQMLQAENQIHTQANNLHVPALRSITTVRNDAVIRYAINERQEKADKLAAFEQAVKQWNVLVPNAGY